MLSWLLGEPDPPTAVYSIVHPPGQDVIDTSPLRVDEEAHEFAIYSIHIAFGRVVISGSYEVIHVDDLNTGEAIKRIYGDFDWVYALRMVYGITPLIVSGHRDGTIRLWDFFEDLTDSPLKILSGHSNAVVALQVMQGVYPRIISASFDGLLKVWDVTESRCLRTLRGHTKAIRCLAVFSSANTERFSLKSKSAAPAMASGDESGEIFLWSGEYIHLRTILTSTSMAKSMVCCVHNDTPLLLVGRDNGVIAVYDTLSSADSPLLEIQAHMEAVRSLCVPEEPSVTPVIVSGSYDNMVRVWDIESGGCRVIRRQ